MRPPRDSGALDWLQRARSGDREALGALLEHYRPYLALLGRLEIGRRLQSKFDAEDLMQDVCLEVQRGFRRFRGTTEDEFVAWLRAILAGRLANLLRHYHGTRGRNPRLERDLNEALDQSSQALDGALVASGSSPSERAVRHERAVLLARALESLPADHRDVLLLRHGEDLSFPEVARRMGRTVDSVKNIWARSLGKLRQSMEDPR